ncbi:MAG: phosphodiesterase [Burkholderiales bacterium]|nr:phosphodiesterase [Burkholderiales bacterium]
MPSPSTDVPHPQEADYEDLLSLWADLQAGLSMVLAQPRHTADLARKIRQYDLWMQNLLRQDTDTGLYLLFQLATNSAVGYSALHALVCAVLCHVTAEELKLKPVERDSLVRAAMTMNIGMTRLQDTLALQTAKPSDTQQALIRGHASASATLLRAMGVSDYLWLDIVINHHGPATSKAEFQQLEAVHRLTHILGVVDRYAAMVSPRKSRAGRSMAETVRAMLANVQVRNDPVGAALVRAIGQCPPGTFVAMDNGDTALVLRRSATANQPLVATLLNAKNQPFTPPRLHRTSTSAPKVQSALPANTVKTRINHQRLLRQGIQADRGGPLLD